MDARTRAWLDQDNARVVVRRTRNAAEARHIQGLRRICPASLVAIQIFPIHRVGGVPRLIPRHGDFVLMPGVCDYAGTRVP